jgi:hypothetical protein
MPFVLAKCLPGVAPEDPYDKLVRKKKLLVGQLVDVFIDTRPPQTE